MTAFSRTQRDRCLSPVILLNKLGDGVQLDVARALVDGADFGIAIKFLDRIIFGVPE